MEIKQTVRRWLIKASGLLILGILWEAAPRFGWVSETILPKFSTTIHTLIKLWVKNDLYMHIMSSLWRVMTGLMIALAIGAAAGFILSRWLMPVYEAADPLFRVFAKINPFSLIPVFFLFFGIDEEVKLAIVAWVCLWPILFSTVSGVRTVDPQLIKTAESMKLSPPGMVFKVLLPSVSHSIFVGLRISVEMSFYMLVAGEMLGANSGLGTLIHSTAHYFDAPRLYACALVVTLLGVALNWFLRYLQNGLFFWEEPVEIFKSGAPDRKRKRIDRAELFLITVIIGALLVLGTQQIHKAKVIAADPSKALTQDVDN